MSAVPGPNVILAVSGGIAAYKAAEVASRLVQQGATVDAIMTAGAQEFVRPLTFSALTGRAVHTDAFAPWTERNRGHITLAREADLLLVAPASASALARLAVGLADDLLGAVALSTVAPLVVAPAMEHAMFHHPATQEHLETLRRRGASVVGPERGRLASGAVGDGRLAAVEAIVGTCWAILGRAGALAGRRIVVTAGGTREPLDPVRFLGNRSSGTMGFALSTSARDRGAAVHLVTGPTSLPSPAGITVERVETALEMRSAVEAAVPTADALIMAAAVADFRPATPSAQKLKKGPGDTAPEIQLIRNPDILASVSAPGLVKVGFAAETENLVPNASAKLAAKGLAMIVANDAASTVGSAEISAVILQPNTPPRQLPSMPKSELAGLILDHLLPLLPRRTGDGGDE